MYVISNAQTLKGTDSTRSLQHAQENDKCHPGFFGPQDRLECQNGSPHSMPCTWWSKNLAANSDNTRDREINGRAVFGLEALQVSMLHHVDPSGTLETSNPCLFVRGLNFAGTLHSACCVACFSAYPCLAICSHVELRSNIANRLRVL